MSARDDFPTAAGYLRDHGTAIRFDICQMLDEIDLLRQRCLSLDIERVNTANELLFRFQAEIDRLRTRNEALNETIDSVRRAVGP